MQLKVSKTKHIYAAAFAFWRHLNASLRYMELKSHEGLTHCRLYQTDIANEFNRGSLCTLGLLANKKPQPVKTGALLLVGPP